MKKTPDTVPVGVSPGEPAPPRNPEPTPITWLDRIIARCSTAVGWLAFVAMAISVYEVFMRYALHSPTSWVHETTVMLIAIIFAFGGPIALARNKHIRVRFVYDNVGPKGRYVLDLINGVLTLIFTFGISYAAWVMFWTASHNPTGAWQLERSGTSWNPPFPALIKAVILFAVALMMVQAILHLIHTLRHGPDYSAETTDMEGN
ncbi:TRAP transporter small permease subunit [Tropicimonas isoalkanivorans]|uniref:TRAP transporter small permease protein n=1 Tax=Tropicimonas isoalkanivorans TaxID=441112 RepID=A0A1I1K0H0_9RHOB|nr:TRAP transporter small permease [Tropicimonas isoalkanivorans]SFC54314.1 TRAP-type mannitol/chloroaromatic compound transport system, small permease component [Tropicimonas isoalkanivorans]